MKYKKNKVKDKQGGVSTLRTVGGKRIGASLLTSKEGFEVQAGAGKVHADLGYDKKTKTVGGGVRVGNKQYSQSISLEKYLK